MNAREKAVGILGARKLRMLEEARLVVVDAVELETKNAWITYLEAQLKLEGKRDELSKVVRDAASIG